MCIEWSGEFKVANKPSKTEIEVSTEASADMTVTGTVRVLLVDDDAGFSKAASQLLEMQGNFQVETARNVSEALEKLEKGSYDAVASDYQMPGKNGLEFLEELRLKGNGIPRARGLTNTLTSTAAQRQSTVN
jgi:CheY-like chemotaxis protein